jgi:hypothetical protein
MSITLRLLSACRQAYMISGDGPVAPVPGVGPVPASGGVGWIGARWGVTAGMFGQDAAFVGSISEGVVVAIRGTTPGPGGDPDKFVVDWADDFAAPLVAAPQGMPGRVHWGFLQASARLWAKLQPLVAAAVQPNPARTIFVTGHSKGGALCPLIAWMAAQDFPLARIVVRAFAPARVADDAFASVYNARIADHVRYEFGDDVVPHLPADPDLAASLGVPAVLAKNLLSASDLAYGAVGRLAYIQADGSIIGESAELEQLRMENLLARLAAPGALDYISACHSVDDPGAGYVRASYPA